MKLKNEHDLKTLSWTSVSSFNMVCNGGVPPDVVFLVLLQLVCWQSDGLAAPSML